MFSFSYIEKCELDWTEISVSVVKLNAVSVCVCWFTHHVMDKHSRIFTNPWIDGLRTSSSGFCYMDSLSSDDWQSNLLFTSLN